MPTGKPERADGWVRKVAIHPFHDLVRKWEGACCDSIDARWCGCGMPWTVYQWIRDALVITSERPEWNASKAESAAWDAKSRAFWGGYPDGVQQLLAGVLDGLGLTEHGGSWYGQWLTDEGSRVLAILRDMTDAEIEEMHDSARPYLGCGCLPGPCSLCGATT